MDKLRLGMRACILFAMLIAAVFPAAPSLVRSAYAYSVEQIAYAYHGDIFVADLINGQLSNPTLLIRSGSANMPTWSPSGRYLMYREDAPALVIYDAASGTAITHIDGASSGGWSANEDRMFYVLGQTLYTASPDNSAPEVWNDGLPGTAVGRISAARNGEIYLTLVKSEFNTQVWVVYGPGSLEQLSYVDYGGVQAENCVMQPTISNSLAEELAVTINTNCLAFAPGGYSLMFRDAAAGVWQELAQGENAMWSPDNARLVYDAWLGCKEMGVNEPGFCQAGIGIIDRNSGEKSLVLRDPKARDPAWRSSSELPAVPQATEPPAVTEPPVVPPPAATEPPAVPPPAATQPPAAQALVGLITDVTVFSGMTAAPQPVFIPCGSSELIEYGSRGQFGSEQYFRFDNAQLVDISPYDSDMGQVHRRLATWSGEPQVTSCQEVGLPMPILDYRNKLVLNAISFNPQPTAFQPFKLILQLDSHGRTIEDDPFVVEVDFGEDFPYKNLHFVFDSENPDSAAFMDPNRLQNADMNVQLQGLRFPAAYMGSVVVSTHLKSEPELISSVSQAISVGASSQSGVYCSSAALLSTDLAGLEYDAQATATRKFMEYQQRLELCGSDLACQADAVQDFQQEPLILALEKGAEQTPVGKIALFFKKLIEFGLDAAKCKDWLALYFNQLMQGQNVGGVLTQSPVYPLVTAPDGRQTGFRPDGSLVQDIPDSYALQIEEDRLVLLPPEQFNRLEISGYNRGTLDLSVAAPAQGRAVLTYHQVPVEAGSQMQLNPADSQAVLSITSGGQTTQRLPDGVSANPTQPTAQQPGGICSSPGLLVLAPLALLILRRRRLS